MKCQEVRRYLSPYLDSALEATTTYDISRHLERCAACARVFRDEEQLDRAVFARLRDPDGDDPALFERALARALPPPRAPYRLAAALLATAALVAAVAGLGSWLARGDRSPDVQDLIRMVALDHERLLAGELEPELETGDRRALSAFMEERLPGGMGGLPPGPEWQLQGARICRFEDTPVGFVSLRRADRPVSMVDLPASPARYSAELLEATAEGRCFELEGGRGIVRLTPRGLRAVFGDIEMWELEEVVAAAR